MRWIRCRMTLKSNNCTEPKSVNLAAIRGKVIVLIRGGLTIKWKQRKKLVVTTHREKSADAIPAIQRRASTIIISELGIDLSVLPSAGRLCKWVGLCPGDNESAKKKKTTRITKGNPRIKSVMVQYAWAATRCKNFFLRDWFYRLRARRGTKKALIAVARKLLSIVWHILTTGEIYAEERYEETKKSQEEKRKQKLKAEAAKLGFKLIPA